MFGERIDRRPVTSRAAFVAALGMLAFAVPIAATTMDDGRQPRVEPIAAVSNAMSGIAPFLSPPVVTATPTMPSRSTLALRDRRSSTRPTASVRVTPPSAANAAQNAAVALKEIPAAGSASFSGIVRGPAGAPMAGVPVVITDPVTGAARTVKAAADGSFTFFALPVGRYVVTVTTPGWATRRYDVSLEDGQQTERTVEMRMGMFAEALTVAAPRPVGSSVPGPSAASGAQTSRVSPPARTRRCDGNGLNCVTAPIKLVDVRPAYPAEALERGAQGVVILEATIGPSGEVSDARVLRSPDPALAAAALGAVQQWEFTPTLLDNMPTAIIMTVSVNFSLQGN
jgi:TonB family protein